MSTIGIAAYSNSNKSEFLLTNKAKQLQEGRDKAKDKFSTNALKELTINRGHKEIILSHPDEYNFVVTINDKTLSYFGTLGQAILKLYREYHNTIDLKRNDPKQYSQRIINFIEDTGYVDLKPSMPCSLIDIEEIKREVA